MCSIAMALRSGTKRNRSKGKPKHKKAGEEIRNICMEGHIIRALGFLSLKIQFPFLASGAGFFQRDTCRLQHDGAYVSCRMRADRDAPHTGDTLFLSVLLGSFRSIACTGHCRAHTPHSVQSLEVFGTIPPPLLLL